MNARVGIKFENYLLKHPEAKEQEHIKKNIRYQITENLGTIIYSVNGARLENQFVYKSKRLKFDYAIDSFGLFEIDLEGGYIIFRDSMRMTGTITLTKQCHDYKLHTVFCKTEFPHAFVNRTTLYHKGVVHAAKYWNNNKIPEQFINVN